MLKEDILDYNRQDCVAVNRVADFLLTLGSPRDVSKPGIQLATEIRQDSHGKFCSRDFAIPEMRFINHCARFDYQRDKLLVRTDPAVRASARRRGARTRTILKPNVEIRCDPPTRCPACGANQITCFRITPDSKLVLDLKLTRTGVKRWVVKYSSRRCQCTECLKTFYSDKSHTHQQTGHELASWALYHHVALRQSFVDVAFSITDIFGYQFSSHLRTTSCPQNLGDRQ